MLSIGSPEAASALRGFSGGVQIIPLLGVSLRPYPLSQSLLSDDASFNDNVFKASKIFLSICKNSVLMRSSQISP